MNADIKQILHHFFQKNLLEEVHVADIEQVVTDYPYFAPAQYLLAKKYLQTDNEAYKEQAAKTAVFFNNPHWLHLQLHDEEMMVEDDSGWVTHYTAAAMKPETKDAPAVEETAIPSNTAFNIAEEIAEPVKEEEIVTIADEPEQEIQGAVFMEEVNNTVEETDTAENDGDVEIMEDEIPLSTEPIAGSTTKLKLILEQDLPADAAEASIVPIEPLHTIDYFASQGIKADSALEGKDKLSVKLKSFTDWLKTMKRIHPEKFNAHIDTNTQSAIQHIAEHSNESKEVVTETMAEVFARQGLNQKAAEVYHKLSLLNPDKRVYFAAKIAQLKET